MDFKEIINKITDFALSAGVKILLAIIILIIGFRLINWLIKRLRRAKLFERTDKSVSGFAISFSSIALKIILLITVAAYLGVPMTSMIALVGSAGVAIGLALQGGLSNIASGIMILLFRPFSVGDYINNNGREGTVTSVGIFHTTLTTIDQRRVVIPNSVLTGEALTNYSNEPLRRVDIDFSASYNDDVDKVKKVLCDTATAIPQTLDDPAVESMLVEHSDSALKYRVRAWCKAEDYWTVYFALQENVVKNFRKEGISIPYPQLDVHMDK